MIKFERKKSGTHELLSTGKHCTAVFVINRLSRPCYVYRSTRPLMFGVQLSLSFSPAHMEPTNTDTVDHCVVYVLVAFCPAHVKPIMSCSKLISGSQKRSRNP